MIIRNFRISLLGNFPASLRPEKEDISASQHKASLAGILMSFVFQIPRSKIMHVNVNNMHKLYVCGPRASAYISGKAVHVV